MTQSFGIDEELSSSSRSVLETYSELKEILSRSIKEMESSQNTSVQFQMTSTPIRKDKDKLSHLHQFTDRKYIPSPITYKKSDPEEIERLCISRANEECDESKCNSTYMSSELPFMASKKHLSSDISSKQFSVECSTLPIQSDKQTKCSLNHTNYNISESKYTFVSFESHDDQRLKDQTLSFGDLKEKHSDTDEIESGRLEMTDISLQLSGISMSVPVTSVSQVIDHAQDLTKVEVPSLHQSNVLLSCWSIGNTDHLIPTTSCHDYGASEEKIDKINTLKNENCYLEKQFKNVEDRDISKVKDVGYVFRIQELESCLTESDQLHMQEQRLKSKTLGVQMALKHLRINEQYLIDENLRYREQISRLKTEKNFLQLRLSKAEQDGEEYFHEIKMITDKCEELLNQRKLYQDKKNHLSVEKLFLLKEIMDLKREKNRNAEQLAFITAEKDKLVQMLNSIKTMLFTCANEIQELQSGLREALAENSDLRKRNANKTQQQKMNDSKESWSNEEATERNELSTLEMTDL
ncbi:coiled-coil domain-containing protein 110 isoform X2 [Rhinoderma darwinii]|uniref:coiled-coil domain-containing protein 110 isoform X2 n=1 Tax=Rhinoderma darwinii TaxID=43563 RepID=UPI003F6670D0